jgi:acetate kinase
MSDSIIITCNAGSTNSKLALFDAESLEKIDSVKTKSEAETLGWLGAARGKNVTAIGHRVVHGGGVFTQPTLINADVIRQLEEFIPLAPLHQPAALKLIFETSKLFPEIPQIACFDTAFHSTISKMEQRFALPESLYAEGVRRYGFHGLSYEYIASVLPENIANSRVVVAHLGGGASACAIKNRVSQASTMGFSTLDGLMMGSRCGTLDVGVILHLLQHKKMSVGEVEKLLYKKSGLLGVSGISAEMSDLLASDLPQAKTAIELFCYNAAKQIAGLIPALGGLDALVFTGGIGEHAGAVRDKICAHLAWVSDFLVHTIATNEELVIARACKTLKTQLE